MNEEKKRWVRERYGKIATASSSGCCGEAKSCCGASTDCGAATEQTVAEKIGYVPDDLASVPEGANLNLGCGNPLALASITPGEVVLDLGSGAGFDAFLAAARVGPEGQVIGVDMTLEMIERARANATRGGYANVDFRLGEIEALPVADASVDLVISNCVLNLVPDKPRAFAEIVRVLKPGGRFAVSDIVLDGPLPKCLQGDPDGYCSCVSGAIARDEYLAGLAAAGLVDVRVESEADAIDLLSDDDEIGADMRGIATSVHVTARKPVA
jgi:SAM-dependent methyltransferase